MSESQAPATIQPRLFKPEKAARPQTPDDLPRAWSLLERLLNEEADARRTALTELAESGLVSQFPLVAWAIAARTLDSNADIRVKAVHLLAAALDPSAERVSRYEEIRQAVAQWLRTLDGKDLARMIGDRPNDPETRHALRTMFNLNSRAGERLAALAADRSLPLTTRKEAIHHIGVIGFSEAKPELERLSAKLQARVRGQRGMPFAPMGDSKEESLLPELSKTLALLAGD
ncbi:MAG: hypothetical protein HYZ26_06915 [Chloroflexi bacterium]|nr:hypothetical protein [Chloroflexota bacterium]